ncbi:MAG TPA: hypothetical protein VLX61_08730 [Anaerolineales bacterium]|nr:hypothetical protein [Anaerolineales bacterium]
MANVKTVVLRFLVFLFVFVATSCVTGLAFYYFSTIYPIPFAYEEHDAGASIEVWLDANGNGIWDNNEPAVPNTCVWAGYLNSFTNWQDICNGEGYKTDTQGVWGDFFPGGTCEEIYNAVNIPNGYFPTTPTVVIGCTAEFGLAQEKPTSTMQSAQFLKDIQKIQENEYTIHRLELVAVMILILIFAGFVSIKVIRRDV